MLHGWGPQLSALLRSHPPLHPSPQILNSLEHSRSSYSNPYSCTHAKANTTLCNWLRIRAHGLLLNLWRLCIMLESVEIMQCWDIMPPFSLIVSLYYFPWLCRSESSTYFIPFSTPILYFILFLVFTQFSSVVHSLFPCFLPFSSIHPHPYTHTHNHHHQPSTPPLSTPLSYPPPPCLSSLGPLAVSPQVMFSWPDDACISLVSS